MSTRKNALLYSCAIALAASAALLGAEDNEDALLARAQQIFKPLPADAGTPDRPLTPERVALGRALFFETRVSSDGKGSCGGCHNPFLYGTDALPRSEVAIRGRDEPMIVRSVDDPAVLTGLVDTAAQAVADRKHAAHAG